MIHDPELLILDEPVSSETRNKQKYTKLEEKKVLILIDCFVKVESQLVKMHSFMIIDVYQVKNRCDRRFVG